MRTKSNVIFMLLCASHSNRALLLLRSAFRRQSQVPSGARQMQTSSGVDTAIPKRSLEEFGVGENTVQKYLVADPVEMKDGSQLFPRQIRKVHFTPVLPERVPTPYLIAASKSCANMLELNPDESNRSKFSAVFSGNNLLPGLDKPYATVYGCHSYGQWFGQLGDGRALSIGEVYTSRANTIEDVYKTSLVDVETVNGVHKDSAERQAVDSDHYYGNHIFELQLKGCGRSPFSRGFDGKAVVRSSVREFLVSEAMHHLGVPTTRALSVVGTGETIRRAWYDVKAPCDGANATSVLPSHASATTGKFAPNMLLAEPGAVLCRVSRSFLRFGQLELFAQRQEWAQLLQLADFVCFREYPDLLDIRPLNSGSSDSEAKAELPASRPGERIPLPETLTPGPVERYVALYRRIAQRTATLVAHWLRVGYVQGNMNSDNTLLSGATIDYGPYGWMERYDPFYQPFTSDSRGNFAFVRQPSAMNLNVAVLGETTFGPLIKHVYMMHVGDEENTNLRSLEDYEEELRQIAETEFTQYFTNAYNEVKRRKLGLMKFRTGPAQAETSEESEGGAEASALGGTGDPTQAATTEADEEANEEVGEDEQLWRDLEKLMAASDCDFTILFRELGKVAESFAQSAPARTATAGSGTARAVSGSDPKASQHAAMFIPSTPDVSLFPNIDFAVAQDRQQQAEATQRMLEEAMQTLSPAFYTPAKVQMVKEPLGAQWRDWLRRYRTRILADAALEGGWSPAQRRFVQDHANPKYVLRNWMAALAYERAHEGDYSVVHELTALLEHPYADAPPVATPHADAAAAATAAGAGAKPCAQAAQTQTQAQAQAQAGGDKWYCKTPSWARNLPGVAFMS